MPISTNLVQIDLLSPDELQWLNDVSIAQTFGIRPVNRKLTESEPRMTVQYRGACKTTTAIEERRGRFGLPRMGNTAA